jgi:GDP-L-fucose synthase
MYGPDDHFEEERSHAMGALIMKIVEAKRSGTPHVVVWGTGKPVREWLYVDDGAEAMVRALDIPYHEGPINVGVGHGISVIDMANLIKQIVGYEGDLVLDPTKPDGAAYKTVDGSMGERVLGWKPSADFESTVRDTVNWYLKNR